MVRITKICNQKFLIFVKYFKTHKINIIKSANLFYCFKLYTRRRCSQIEPKLKVEIKVGTEALLKHGKLIKNMRWIKPEKFI